MTVSRFLKVPGMTRPASRAKQIERIESRGASALKSVVWDILMDQGADFLTDEQLSVITSKLVAEDRFRQHLNMRNRSRASVRFQQAAE